MAIEIVSGERQTGANRSSAWPGHSDGLLQAAARSKRVLVAESVTTPCVLACLRYFPVDDAPCVLLAHAARGQARMSGSTACWMSRSESLSRYVPSLRTWSMLVRPETWVIGRDPAISANSPSVASPSSMIFLPATRKR